VGRATQKTKDNLRERERDSKKEGKEEDAHSADIEEEKEKAADGEIRMSALLNALQLAFSERREKKRSKNHLTS
jgi:hypothetical protein